MTWHLLSFQVFITPKNPFVISYQHILAGPSLGFLFKVNEQTREEIYLASSMNDIIDAVERKIAR